MDAQSPAPAPAPKLEHSLGPQPCPVCTAAPAGGAVRVTEVIGDTPARQRVERITEVIER